jgi:hypothetical protein
MVCFPVCLSKHHTKIHTGEYSNCVCILHFVPAVHGHKMSAAYPGHIISDAHRRVGRRAGLEAVKNRLTPTPLRKMAVFLLYNPALPKQRSKKKKTSSGVSWEPWSKQTYTKTSKTRKDAKCAPQYRGKFFPAIGNTGVISMCCQLPLSLSWSFLGDRLQ